MHSVRESVRLGEDILPPALCNVVRYPLASMTSRGLVPPTLSFAREARRGHLPGEVVIAFRDDAATRVAC
jgi:hypothetical protein